jgi:hypothetical protein
LIRQALRENSISQRAKAAVLPMEKFKLTDTDKGETDEEQSEWYARNFL